MTVSDVCNPEPAYYHAPVVPSFNALVLMRALALVFFISLSTAQSSTPWFYRDWRADDGLPGDNVTGVVQTRDGYLWIATQSGLARFDGVRIKSIRLPGARPDPIIRAMCRDQADRLWLALEGGAVVRWSPTETRTFTANDGLSQAQPAELEEGDEGAIWISYLDGSACRIAGETVQKFTDADGLAGSGVCSLSSDVNGQIWFAQGGQVGSFNAGKFVTTLTRNERYVQVLAARKGGPWICAGNQLFKYERGGELIELGRLAAEAATVRPVALFEDRSGALWIGTSAEGLFRYDETGITKVGTSHDRIQAIMEDREGSIWVGTEGGGLNRLRLRALDLQGKDEGLPFDTVRSICEDNTGNIWLVMQNGDVARNDGSGWQTLSTAESWPGGQATSVVCDTNGVVHIGTYSRGVYRWHRGALTNTLRVRNGLASMSVRSLLADSRGNVWIAFSAGDTLQRYRDGEFQNFALPAERRAIRAMAEDSEGRIWMANLDAQLLRVDGDKIVDETSLTPEPYRPIRCLVGTPDGSLWIGYSKSGVARLKSGQFNRIGIEQGLQDGNVCSLMPDQSGWMWFGSDHGIFRVSVSELNDAMDGKIATVKSIRHGRDDGLPSVLGYYGYSPGAARTRDGRVLLPTHSGLIIAHPDRLQTVSVPPPVLIESVRVDNQVMTVTDNSAGSFSPKHHKIEIFFNAPSFIEPEKVRFRYWLEGWDDSWNEIPEGGDRHALYRVPAGDYRFHVTAGNSAGVWNEAGAAVAFEVRQFFWKTWWFTSLSALALGSACVASVRYISLRRLRLKVQRLERENALQKERARIAQDIHDDIGAHMTRISLLTDLTTRHLNRPGEAAGYVNQIARMTRSASKALDEIVWAANPRNDTVPDLLDYAGQYGVDFLQLAGVRCRVDFPNHAPGAVLSGETRHGLFLAVKEALHNVVKHAQASEVWLRADVADHRLALSVEDNGRGFAIAPDNALADGLRNMQRRLAELGGKCSIESNPGAGTRIRFEVPLSKHV